MIEQLACPHCGQPIAPQARQCPHCNQPVGPRAGAPLAALTDAPDAGGQPAQPRVSPETLVPRLGDTLVEIGVLMPEDIERALEYQRQRSEQGTPVLMGEALIQMGLTDRETIDAVITKQLVSLQTTLRDTNRQLDQRLRQRSGELERRVLQIRATAELTQIASNTPAQDVLLRRAVNLIADRFAYDLVAIFLLDADGQTATLTEASGEIGERIKQRGLQITAGTPSFIEWVMTHKQPRVAADVNLDSLYLRDELLPHIRSEAATPIAIGETVLGVLDVQHAAINAFEPDAVAVLQTLANHLATSIQNARLIESTRINLNVMTSLYQASHSIAQANSAEEILAAIVQSLRQAPFITAALRARQASQFELIAAFDSENAPAEAMLEALPALWPLESADLRRSFANREALVFDAAFGLDFLPALRRSELLANECRSIALIPVLAGETLEAILLLASRRSHAFTAQSLQPYTSLAEVAATAIAKVKAQQGVEKRLAALQSLNTISQAVSTQTDLNALYQAVHQEVRQIMGDVYFVITIYDNINNLIQVPYVYDYNQVYSIAPFPLGEGLTSIILRTRQPLLLVEDVERKSRELGAIIIGAPARSWLGVPLLVGGEPIGAVVVQDLEQEFRFDEDDLRLLSTLASQVAVAIRNARIIESTQRQAERERQLYEISSKIRSSTQIQTILETTAREIAKALNARKAHIEIRPAVEDSAP